MSRIAKSRVHEALDRAAEHILAARGDDPTVSRKDIRQKLKSLSGTEKALTDIFYRLIDRRDYKPGARVTESDVKETLAYAKSKLIDAYDENNNGLSRAEVKEMSTTGKLAVALARQILASDDESKMLAQLRELGEGHYWLGGGSEHDPVFRFFHLEAQLEVLTQESFREALGLDPVNPEQAIFVFEQGYEDYGRNFEPYEYYEEWEKLSEIKSIDRFMRKNLRQVTHIIVGIDGYSSTSQYPVYFVGLTPSGHIAGFETELVWT